MTDVFFPQKELHWTLQKFEGPDARDFLHRLTTVRAHALNPGEGSLGFFLNANGKICAQFYLQCTSENGFAFEYDAGRDRSWETGLAQSVDQYTFSERQQLSAPEKLHNVWVFLPPAEKVSSRELPQEFFVIHRGVLDFGLEWFSIWGDEARLRQWVSERFVGAREMSWEELQKRRIQQVRPWVDHELSTDVMPLEVGLSEGIAENKGCYPGQEVIERIISQGAPPRRLVRVRASGAPGSAGEQASEVVATTWSGEGGLVLVRKNLAVVGQKLSISGQGEVSVEACSNLLSTSPA